MTDDAAAGLAAFGPEVISWLTSLDEPAELGGRPERLLEAAEGAGVELDATEAEALAEWLSTLGPNERVARWAG